METMFASGRRSLPPVPRRSPERTTPPSPEAAGGERGTDGAPGTEAVSSTRGVPDPEAAAGQAAPVRRRAGDTAQRRVTGHAAGEEPIRSGQRSSRDDAQEFVTRLRAAGPRFAHSAGAQTAVVCEAVPPARHRRSRCRVVLRYPDGRVQDLTFLGAAGTPRAGFEAQIRRWLEDGQRRGPAWTVGDEDAPDGLAIDISAWCAGP